MVLALSFPAPSLADSEESTGLTKPEAQAMIGYLFPRLQCTGLDGFIDDAEVDEHIGQVWLPADLDRSRGLTPDEFQLLHRRLASGDENPLFTDADANRDGVVRFPELRQQLGRLLALLDENGDALVSLAEAGTDARRTQRPAFN